MPRIRRIGIGILLGVLFTQHSLASPDAFCLKGKRVAQCMEALLALKCRQYQPSLLAPEFFRLGACAKEAHQAIAILDPIAFADDTVIYSRELIGLLQTQAAVDYLNSIREALDSQAESFDLWIHTLNQTHQNTTRATQLLAVLFQDTNPDPAALHWAIHSKKIPDSTLTTYTQVLAAFTPAAVKEARVALRVYPHGLDAILNPTFYHFYTMQYWAQRLAAKKMKAKEAFFYPFALNTEYEYRTLGVKKWPFQEPTASVVIKTPHTLGDVYAGYLAATTGAFQNSPQLQPSLLTLGQFQSALETFGPAGVLKRAKTNGLVPNPKLF